jgi:hypothetical protein
MLATVGLVAFWYSATLLFNYTFFKLTRIKNDEAVKMVAQDITVIEMFTCTVLGVLTLYSKELPFVPVPAVRVRVLRLVPGLRHGDGLHQPLTRADHPRLSAHMCVRVAAQYSYV